MSRPGGAPPSTLLHLQGSVAQILAPSLEGPQVTALAAKRKSLIAKGLWGPLVTCRQREEALLELFLASKESNLPLLFGKIAQNPAKRGSPVSNEQRRSLTVALVHAPDFVNRLIVVHQ